MSCVMPHASCSLVMGMEGFVGGREGGSEPK